MDSVLFHLPQKAEVYAHTLRLQLRKSTQSAIILNYTQDSLAVAFDADRFIRFSLLMCQKPKNV